MTLIDWETWLVEEAGPAVIEKKIQSGQTLADAERLIYCLWAADYGMRNAGDLETAADLYPQFQSEGSSLAVELGLQITAESFRFSTLEFEAVYFEKFDEMCAEVATALSAADSVD